MGSEQNREQMEPGSATPYNQNNSNQSMDGYNSGSMYGTPNYGSNDHHNQFNEYKERNIQSTDSGNFNNNGYNEGHMYYQSSQTPLEQPYPPRGRGRGWRGRGWRGAIHHYGGYMYDHDHGHGHGHDDENGWGHGRGRGRGRGGGRGRGREHDRERGRGRGRGRGGNPMHRLYPDGSTKLLLSSQTYLLPKITERKLTREEKIIFRDIGCIVIKNGIQNSELIERALRKINHSLGQGTHLDNIAPQTGLPLFNNDILKSSEVINLFTQSDAFSICLDIFSGHDINDVVIKNMRSQIALRFPENPDDIPLNKNEYKEDTQNWHMDGFQNKSLPQFNILCGIALRNEYSILGNLHWPPHIMKYRKYC